MRAFCIFSINEQCGKYYRFANILLCSATYIHLTPELVIPVLEATWGNGYSLGGCILSAVGKSLRKG